MTTSVIRLTTSVLYIDESFVKKKKFLSFFDLYPFIQLPRK